MQETEHRREIDPHTQSEHQAAVDEDHSHDFDPADLEPRPFDTPSRKRVLIAVGVLLTLVLLAVLPPLISVNRFQRQITRSISASLGRPVHMGSITLNMLPMPGFTLEQFVVGEDPEFGSEPVIRADSVRATLRFSSLWRRRLEFSRISLVDPSVNLVHRADGRWNIESILLQASKIEAAPTAQASVGPAPRFPYIEATGARVNVKMGLEKMPIALTEADFALWLPQPQQWRLRLEGHPARTDAATTDTGTLRLQGTLGKASALADVPIDLTADWRAAPLGAVSWILLGRDAGFRGTLTLQTHVLGTVGESAVESHLELAQVRRTDFVPARMLDVDLTCAARASSVFHRLNSVRCAWPSNAAETGLVVQGEVPEVLQPSSATGEATVTAMPAATLLDALRLVSARIAPELKLSGIVSARAVRGAAAGGSPTVTIAQARLALGDGKPFVDQDVAAKIAGEQVALEPVALDLGAPQAASLELHLDRAGYGMRLSGPALRSRLMQLAEALPQFGDGLAQTLPAEIELAAGAAETPIRLDLVSTRTWCGGQVWTAAAARPAAGKRAGRRR